MTRSLLIIKMFLFGFLFSCEFSTPTINGDSTAGTVNLRPVRVECSENSFCKNNQGGSFEARAIYLNDKCDGDVTNVLNPIAISTIAVKCDSKKSCNGIFKAFKTADGVDDQFVVSQNKVNLLVFVDVNLNEVLDEGEPVNCNENISLRIKNNKSDISIKIKRLL